jgi:ATP-dependent Lhr-like helicase
VNSFDRLHPALQHHIVNSLGWRELRPLQELSIGPILAGQHVLLLAPTAGGKTESAFFPVLSRMLADQWTGLSVIYVCPLKALLNNLHTRLEQYCRLVGRTCGLWHGDVQQARRQRILRDVPDCLLTTPESLEAMLVSRKVEHRALFRDVHAFVVDEIHAFAGDDRGWHLLAVLERVTRLAGREPQRIGLSATVGNPDGLLNWLAGHCGGQRAVVAVPVSGAEAPEVQVDYVGSLENAAVVVCRLHRGEKRLIFCDSRSRVEQLGARLRELGVETYLSHSSLSVEERRRAEAAFSQGANCVIVATSTLELGIDVGDLDRVIQVDAPGTVASFLQRLGRSGRREGARRNCLFLATSLDALHQAVAVVHLWQQGYVEPVEPPPLPLHLLAQQLLALVLQEGGIGRQSWQPWLLRLPPFASVSEDDREAIVWHLLETRVLHEDQGILGIGPTGEADYGYRHFSELLSVFTTAPLFTVLHGRQEIGTVDQANFLARGSGGTVLTLAGRSWRVAHLDWPRRQAHVEPAAHGGTTCWWGGAPGLGFRLSQAMLEVVSSEEVPPFLSNRGKVGLRELRAEFAWARPATTCLLPEASDGGAIWWTFGGSKANSVLAHHLRRLSGTAVTSDSLTITWNARLRTAAGQAAGACKLLDDTTDREWSEEAEEALKFAELLPPDLRRRILVARITDTEALAVTSAEPVRVVAGLPMEIADL